jgi:hypothetical protein
MASSLTQAGQLHIPDKPIFHVAPQSGWGESTDSILRGHHGWPSLVCKSSCAVTAAACTPAAACIVPCPHSSVLHCPVLTCLHHNCSPFLINHHPCCSIVQPTTPMVLYCGVVATTCSTSTFQHLCSGGGGYAGVMSAASTW